MRKRTDRRGAGEKKAASSREKPKRVTRPTEEGDGTGDGKRPATTPVAGQTGSGQSATDFVRVTLDEFNLATFPISVLDKKAQSSREPLTFHDNVTLNGERIERVWKVFPHPEKGFPGPIDDDVLMALLELTREQGGAKKVYFSRYDLLKRLGWSINATYYQRLETSFKKLAAVRVEAINAFGDRNKKRLVNMGLTFIQEWKLNAETRGGERSSYVLWSDRIAESIHQKLTRYLDATFYFEELTSPIERRLFRYLDNHFDGKHQMLTLNVRDLSHEHLGISRQYKYISQIMQRLEPALNLFVEKGYLESWLLSGENLHVYRKPNFMTRVQLALPFLAAFEPTPDTDGSTVGSRLERLLAERGVAPSVAARLCEPDEPEQRARVERAIAYFDAEVASGKQFANPGGFLVSLVAKGTPADGRPEEARQRGKSADHAVATPSARSSEPFEVEFAYQGYLNDTGLRRYNEIPERERQRLVDAKRRELLESTHRATFRKMPPDAFEEHVRYMVRKDLSVQYAEPFETWQTGWEDKITRVKAG
jgi:hypothetical protein